MVCVVSELRDRLGDEYIEPVHAFGLVTVHIVVGFREDGGCSQGRRGAEDGGKLLGSIGAIAVF